MKIFISHKKEDSELASRIYSKLTSIKVDAYLDLIDTDIKIGGKQLTDHIKANLNQCSDIFVVMSEETKHSWWVPFEIGMSAQVDMPTATCLKQEVVLPDYLTYWPRLKNLNDIELYVRIKKSTTEEARAYLEHHSYNNRQKYETDLLYAKLKKELG